MEDPIQDPMEERMEMPKMRHGCATVYLIFMIIANSATALIYLVAGDMVTKNLPDVEISFPVLITLSAIGTMNVVFAVSLLKYKKWAFFGFVGSAVVTFAINLVIGIDIGQCIMGLAGIAILYGVLKMRKDGVSGWDSLE